MSRMPTVKVRCYTTAEMHRFNLIKNKMKSLYKRYSTLELVCEFCQNFSKSTKENYTYKVTFNEHFQSKTECIGILFKNKTALFKHSLIIENSETLENAEDVISKKIMFDMMAYGTSYVNQILK